MCVRVYALMYALVCLLHWSTIVRVYAVSGREKVNIKGKE